MRLADVIGRWIGKVEIVLAGADEDLRQGQDALTGGDAMGARAAARRVLARAPDSPLGLALLADACEAAHLDAELAQTLEALARRAPSRAEVWVRLAHARTTTGAAASEAREALVRALAVAEAGSEPRRDALVSLADLDLAAGDAARAQLWLDRAAGADRAPDIVLRRAEASLLRGDAAGANELLESIESPPTDARAALARGRALATIGDAAAFTSLVRAMVLDAPGASEALSSALAYVPSDAQTRARVRSVVDAKGQQDAARWRAAFARAEGARDAARRALREALDAGDAAAARPLLDAAVEDRDRASLDAALAVFASDEADPLVADARRLASALAADRDHAAAALDTLASVTHARLGAWSDAAAAAVARAWIPSEAPAAWPQVLARLDAHAHALADSAAVGAINDLATDRSRPVRLAIVGEFNAGKSTFINALIGADVAPTGVLPTTATLHHLRFAPDPIAKILFARDRDPSERIVALGDLRAALKGLDAASIRRVEILMPLASLVRVEILDTPGFNAPDARHTQVARAAFAEADVAVWLLDATQPMKRSEREVLDAAKAAGLPVLLLANKADRLSADQAARVMASIDEALGETGIATLAPPLALSAKQALAGKLGDEAALAASGWNAVQALLEERIVQRSGELKERALRRRAAEIVRALQGAWAERFDAERAEAAKGEARAHAISAAATRIEAESDEVAARLAKSLAPHAAEWERDMKMVFVGRDQDAAARDPVLARYGADRALEALSPPLARALAAIAPEAEQSPPQLALVARALVRAAASAAPDADRLLSSLARASVATLVEHLFCLSIAPPPSLRAAGVLRELAAFGVSLG